jgi:hypothetical protein
MMVGCPDFIVIIPGRVLLVEVKSKKGKRTFDQQAFRVWAESLGHTVHLVRSLVDFNGLCATYEPNTR